MHNFWQTLGVFVVIPWRHWWTAAAVTLAFAVLARWMRGVTRSGALAGFIVCFVLYAGAGAGAFLALVSVFALAWITTRWGYQQKLKLGIAEKRDGRTASQVLANLGAAAGCVLLYAIGGRAIYLLAMAAALSEAAADTVSSEIGQASGARARLITSWRLVPAGTDGGVSAPGTLAGMAAAAAVSSVCVLTGLLPWKSASIAAAAATGGTLADSYMGALLERRGFISNDLVNFLGTLIAIAIVFCLV
jgi:uncharacterized protein (TIGR00297 family)